MNLNLQSWKNLTFIWFTCEIVYIKYYCILWKSWHTAKFFGTKLAAKMFTYLNTQPYSTSGAFHLKESPRLFWKWRCPPNLTFLSRFLKHLLSLPEINWFTNELVMSSNIWKGRCLTFLILNHNSPLYCRIPENFLNLLYPSFSCEMASTLYIVKKRKKDNLKCRSHT